MTTKPTKRKEGKKCEHVWMPYRWDVGESNGAHILTDVICSRCLEKKDIENK